MPETVSGDTRLNEQAAGRHRQASGRLAVEIALRWFLAAILGWAGLSKLVDPLSFYGAMLEYQLPLPHFFLKITAVVLPWMELFCCLLLVAGIARQGTLFCVAVLLAVFLVMVGQAYLRGLHISCGCFDLEVIGIEKGSKLGDLLESAGFATVRNAVLLGVAVLLGKCRATGELSTRPGCN